MMPRTYFRLFQVLATVLFAGAMTQTLLAANAPSLQNRFATIPLLFEENLGQVDDAVSYLVRAPHSFVYFERGGFTFQILSGSGSESFRVTFQGTQYPLWEPFGKTESSFSYFIGSDPDQWFTGIPAFSGLRMKQAYPSIDVEFRSHPQGLEFDFLVDAGGDPSGIVMAFEGIESVELAEGGHLLVTLPSQQKVELLRPFTFQSSGSARNEIASSYIVLGRHSVGISLGDYDPELSLVIDPIITFSSFLGGSSSDSAHAIQVDGKGNLYITGETASPNFPSTGFVAGARAATDVFVTKIDPTGTKLLFSVFIGGDRSEVGFDLALDSNGNIVVCGETNSFSFPAVPGTVQVKKAGGKDAFVAKVNASGNELLTASYLGGFNDDTAYAVALDRSDFIFLTGSTSSTDFPVTPDAIAGGNGASGEVFVTKLNGSAREWSYSGTVGGGSLDFGSDIAVDSGGRAHVVGKTLSTDLPVVTPVQKDSGGRYDGFVAQVSTAGDELTYLSYLGGSGDDFANALAVDPQGSVATIVGTTSSGNFPTYLPVQGSLAGGSDIFLTVLGLAGGGINFSTFYGGSGDDIGTDLAIGPMKGILITGSTTSPDFPLVDSFQKTLQGMSDAFVAKFAANSFTPVYASYLGGKNADAGHSVAALGQQNALVVGQTASGDFPVKQALDGSFNGSTDGFLAKISETSSLYLAQFADGGSPAGSIKSTIQILNLDSNLLADVNLRIFDSNGNPMIVDLNGETINGGGDYQIAPNGVVSLRTDGSGNLQVGTVSLSASTAISSVLLLQSSSGTTGVGASRLMRRFAAPVQVAAAINTGIAVMNLGAAQQVRIQLVDSLGETVAEAREDLPLNGQFARFISEFDWSEPVDLEEFLGSVIVTGTSDLTGMVLLQTPDGLTTQPVEPKN